MSPARRLNSQAISSSILTTIALAFFSSSCSRRSFSLSAEDLPGPRGSETARTYALNRHLPAYLLSRGITCVAGLSGRSVPHTVSIKFSITGTKDDPSGASLIVSLLASPISTVS